MILLIPIVLAVIWIIESICVMFAFGLVHDVFPQVPAISLEDSSKVAIAVMLVFGPGFVGSKS